MRDEPEQWVGEEGEEEEEEEGTGDDDDDDYDDEDDDGCGDGDNERRRWWGMSSSYARTPRHPRMNGAPRPFSAGGMGGWSSQDPSFQDPSFQDASCFAPDGHGCMYDLGRRCPSGWEPPQQSPLLHGARLHDGRPGASAGDQGARDQGATTWGEPVPCTLYQGATTTWGELPRSMAQGQPRQHTPHPSSYRAANGAERGFAPAPLVPVASLSTWKPPHIAQPARQNWLVGAIQRSLEPMGCDPSVRCPSASCSHPTRTPFSAIGSAGRGRGGREGGVCGGKVGGVSATRGAGPGGRVGGDMGHVHAHGSSDGGIAFHQRRPHDESRLDSCDASWSSRRTPHVDSSHEQPEVRDSSPYHRLSHSSRAHRPPCLWRCVDAFQLRPATHAWWCLDCLPWPMACGHCLGLGVQADNSRSISRAFASYHSLPPTREEALQSASAGPRSRRSHSAEARRSVRRCMLSGEMHRAPPLRSVGKRSWGSSREALPEWEAWIQSGRVGRRAWQRLSERHQRCPPDRWGPRHPCSPSHS